MAEQKTNYQNTKNAAIFLGSIDDFDLILNAERERGEQFLKWRQHKMKECMQIQIKNIKSDKKNLFRLCTKSENKQFNF